LESVFSQQVWARLTLVLLATKFDGVKRLTEAKASEPVKEILDFKFGEKLPNLHLVHQLRFPQLHQDQEQLIYLGVRQHRLHQLIM
jgi:hypothetical protein